MSDKYRFSSNETASLANDATTPSDTSHNASQPRLITYTRAQDEDREDSRGAHQHLNDHWASQSFGSTAQVVDAGRNASLLTQQALHQHNAENIPTNFEYTNKYSHDSYNMDLGCRDSTATYASTLDGHACPGDHVEPYSYPRQSPGLHLPFALAKAGNQDPDADGECLRPSIDHQDIHLYPTFITEADLQDHLAEAGFHNDSSNTNSLSTSSISKDEYLQQVSVAYAGMGAQFSS